MPRSRPSPGRVKSLCHEFFSPSPREGKSHCIINSFHPPREGRSRGTRLRGGAPGALGSLAFMEFTLKAEAPLHRLLVPRSRPSPREGKSQCIINCFHPPPRRGSKSRYETSGRGSRFFRISQPSCPTNHLPRIYEHILQLEMFSDRSRNCLQRSALRLCR